MSQERDHIFNSYATEQSVLLRLDCLETCPGRLLLPTNVAFICYLCADERVDELRMKGVWD